MQNEQLLDNRLAFMTCHRESREVLPGVEIFHGQPPFFKNAFLYEKQGLNHVPETYEIHIPEWKEPDEEFLTANNWKHSDSMIYMALKNNTDNWKVNPDVSIKKAKDKLGIIEFCQIQSQGFSGGDFGTDQWYPTLLKSALNNAFKPDHHFYTAFLDGEPAGVTYTFFHNNFMGIYSVATIERFRKKGVSMSLMKTVVEDGLKAGVREVTLQTMAGSYAESFYGKLGFEPGFECRIYKYRQP